MPAEHIQVGDIAVSVSCELDSAEGETRIPKCVILIGYRVKRVDFIYGTWLNSDLILDFADV